MTYPETLDAYLRKDGNTEAALADVIGVKQPTVNRYRNGRLPDADTARAIEGATDGEVPFAAWQRDFMGRAGIAA